ncbi:MAG: heme-binding domain-containing protein [Flavobacteriaceae bacterium]|nr:heme-binding domain-containing protein [Flavobacteriaceae bacterium]
MRIIKTILILALVVLVVMQFFRPERNNSGYETVAAFEQETKPSKEVANILRKQCYDCHSDQTQYPWYAEVAPVSWWLKDHIDDGKKHFNASAWESYSVKKKDHKLEELIEMVEDGEMPLDSYTWIHEDLSPENKKLLLQWAGLVRLQYVDELKMSSK